MVIQLNELKGFAKISRIRPQKFNYMKSKDFSQTPKSRSNNKSDLELFSNLSIYYKYITQPNGSKFFDSPPSK